MICSRCTIEVNSDGGCNCTEGPRGPILWSSLPGSDELQTVMREDFEQRLATRRAQALYHREAAGYRGPSLLWLSLKADARAFILRLLRRFL